MGGEFYFGDLGIFQLALTAAAYCEPAAIFCAEDESGLFHTRHDNHAVRLIEQILGDTFIRSPHHVGQRVGRSVQPVVDLAFSLRREGGGTNGTGNCQNPDTVFRINFHKKSSLHRSSCLAANPACPLRLNHS
jgi:hypothetical protein